MKRLLTVIASLTFTLLLTGCVSSLAYMTVMREERSRQSSTPESIAESKKKKEADNAAAAKLKADAVLGNGYAQIALATRCFQLIRQPFFGYEEPECKDVDSLAILKKYSELGYDIASYYYASLGLGITFYGSPLEGCEDEFMRIRPSFCRDTKPATDLMKKLTLQGCEYEVETYSGPKTIYPCDRLARGKK